MRRIPFSKNENRADTVYKVNGLYMLKNINYQIVLQAFHVSLIFGFYEIYECPCVVFGGAYSSSSLVAFFGNLR